MVAAKHGLIVNISHWAAQKRIGNTIYGIAKAATDELTRDTTAELNTHGVAVVSLSGSGSNRGGARGWRIRSQQLV